MSRLKTVCALVVAIVAPACASKSPPVARPPVPAPSAQPAAWESAPLQASGPIKLRRLHEVGDSVRAHFKGRSVTVAKPGPGVTDPAPGPVPMEFGGTWEQRIVEVAADGSFVALGCIEGAHVKGPDGKDAIELQCGVKPVRATARNEWPRTDPPVPPGPYESLTVDLTPGLDHFVTPMLYPEAPIASGATWTHSDQWVKVEGKKAPNHARVDVKWTFLGVENSGGALFAHLACDGTFESKVHVQDSSGATLAKARADGRILCAYRLALADGVSSDWRVDFESEGESTVRRGATDETWHTRTSGHFSGGYALSRAGKAPAGT